MMTKMALTKKSERGKPVKPKDIEVSLIVIPFQKRRKAAAAIFQPNIPESGMYWVSVYYVAGINRSVDARYKIIHAGGANLILASTRKFMEEPGFI